MEEHILKITGNGIDTISGEKFNSLLESDNGKSASLSLLSLYLVKHALGEEAGLTQQMLTLGITILGGICNSMEAEYGISMNEAILTMRDTFINTEDIGYLDSVSTLLLEHIDAFDNSVVGAEKRASMN
ncbi:MAG: hypothetical protein KAS32_16670 [Candidatus Peribacteraceae bacterium]|nr:hypothetical protein [Candidatus Peribacteraceae bacterium]